LLLLLAQVENSSLLGTKNSVITAACASCHLLQLHTPSNVGWRADEARLLAAAWQVPGPYIALVISAALARSST
jgi:hypothetical protein